MILQPEIPSNNNTVKNVNMVYEWQKTGSFRVCKQKQLSAAIRSSQTRPTCTLGVSFISGKKTDVPVRNFRINTSLLSYFEMIA